MRTTKLTLATTLLTTLAFAPTLASASGSVTLKGSDTMVILAQRWAEEFMKIHDATVTVTGGGSGTGISALINATTDVCMSSRMMKPTEKQRLRERHNSAGVEIPVAKDGLAIYVHASNPVGEITLEQLRLVYTGKLTNWKELGGPDAKIIPYSRENSSGTYVYFKDEVLRGADFTPRAQTLPGTAAVVNAVAKDKLGMGYGGAAFAKGIKLLKVKREAAAPALLPTAATVADGSYALTRPLYFYVRSKPSGEVAAFIEWALSPAGQAFTTQTGYFPLN